MNKLCSFSLPSQDSSPQPPWWLFTEFPPADQHLFPVFRGPQPDAVLQKLSNKQQAEVIKLFPWSSGYNPIFAAKYTLSPHHSQVELISNLLSSRILRGFPADWHRGSQSVLSLHWCRGLVSHKCTTLHLSVSSIMRFLSAHLSSLAGPSGQQLCPHE